MKAKDFLGKIFYDTSSVIPEHKSDRGSRVIIFIINGIDFRAVQLVALAFLSLMCASLFSTNDEKTQFPKGKDHSCGLNKKFN